MGWGRKPAKQNPIFKIPLSEDRFSKDRFPKGRYLKDRFLKARFLIYWIASGSTKNGLPNQGRNIDFLKITVLTEIVSGHIWPFQEILIQFLL